MGRKVIITNNPAVAKDLPRKYPRLQCEIDYEDCSFREVFVRVRNEVHQGSVILTHPLDGSVKPMETPYKSVLIEVERGGLDEQSLILIENSIMTCDKFQLRERIYLPEVQKDFQTIDRTLLESALESAGLTGEM